MNFISSFRSYVFTHCHINWKQDESHQSSNRLWAIWPDGSWEKCRFQCWVHKSAMLSLHGKRTARIYCSSVWHETSQSEVYARAQWAHAYSSGFGGWFVYWCSYGCVSNTMPQSVWIFCCHWNKENWVQNSVSLEEMDAIGTQITVLQSFE